MQTINWDEFKEQILSQLNFQEIYSGIKNQTKGSDGWISSSCPFHADKNNSFAFNIQNGAWKCFAGCGQGSVFDYVMQSQAIEFKHAMKYLAKKAGVKFPEKKKKEPKISLKYIKNCYDAGRNNKEVVNFLENKRGLTSKIIEKYKIGWDDSRQRNTIPIRDIDGNVQNIRMYNKKAPAKIINLKVNGHSFGSPARLFGIMDIKDAQEVIICEGEFDKLLLEQNGFIAVTSTHGCNSFLHEWILHLKDKDVVMLYDCDDAGKVAALKIINEHLKNSEVSSIKNVELPLTGESDDKDISDFFIKHQKTAAELREIINNTPVFTWQKEEKKEEEIIALDSFLEINKKQYINKKVSCEITISGETSNTYHAPENIEVFLETCPKFKKMAKKGLPDQCHKCCAPITIPINEQVYIGACSTSNRNLQDLLRDYVCPYQQRPRIDIKESATINEFFAHQKMTNSTLEKNTLGRKQESTVDKLVYYISSNRVKPGNYYAEGYVKSIPKSQGVTLLIETLIPQEEDFEQFKLKENLDNLKKLQQYDIKQILDDITDHVTYIYNRDKTLLSVLLTYCSPLKFNFNKENIRGWLNTLIIGDAGTGKTRIYESFMNFTKIGECFSALTGSRTGLTYAIDQNKSGWYVRIGRYPANSRKILGIDETQYLEDFDMRTLSKGMEEGVITVDRVTSGQYESMTRLILIANPKNDKIMNDFTHGCKAISDLYQTPIIRRLDLAVVVNYDDTVSIDAINKLKGEETPQKINSEMMRALIYWAWNLTSENIVFEESATKNVLEKSKGLSEIFGYAQNIPLLNPSDLRKKLARLAAAFAVISLSEKNNFEKLVIKSEHVEKAVDYFIELYSDDNFMLDKYSNNEAEHSIMDDKKYHKIKADLNFYNTRNSFKEVVKCIYTDEEPLSMNDLIEITDLTRPPIAETLKSLKDNKLLISSKRQYVKTPIFNVFFKRYFLDVYSERI